MKKYSEKLRTFLDAESKIASVSSEEDPERLTRLVSMSVDTTPSGAPLMLENVSRVIEFLRDTIARAIDEIETVKKLVATVDPSFSNVLKFNTTGILDELLATQSVIRGAKPDFNDAISLSIEDFANPPGSFGIQEDGFGESCSNSPVSGGGPAFASTLR